MDPQQLIRECKKGSAAAQKCLFDHYAGMMMGVCARYVKNEQDAEEILLDGFYKFFRNIGKFQYKGEAALYAWVKKIMVNECLMFLRKKNAFTMSIESSVEEFSLPDVSLNKLSEEEIFKLIIQLPVGYRTVFNLYAVEGLAHKEIASLLKITEGTSKSQLAKARQTLQKLLKQKTTDYESRKAN